MIKRRLVRAPVAEGLTRTAPLLQHEIVATRLKLNSLESFGAAYRAALKTRRKPMLTELISQEAHLAARHLSALLRYFERIF